MRDNNAVKVAERCSCRPLFAFNTQGSRRDKPSYMCPGRVHIVTKCENRADLPEIWNPGNLYNDERHVVWQ